MASTPGVAPAERGRTLYCEHAWDIPLLRARFSAGNDTLRTVRSAGSACSSEDAALSQVVTKFAKTGATIDMAGEEVKESWDTACEALGVVAQQLAVFDRLFGGEIVASVAAARVEFKGEARAVFAEVAQMEREAVARRSAVAKAFSRYERSWREASAAVNTRNQLYRERARASGALDARRGGEEEGGRRGLMSQLRLRRLLGGGGSGGEGEGDMRGSAFDDDMEFEVLDGAAAPAESMQEVDQALSRAETKAASAVSECRRRYQIYERALQGLNQVLRANHAASRLAVGHFQAADEARLRHLHSSLSDAAGARLAMLESSCGRLAALEEALSVGSDAPSSDAAQFKSTVTARADMTLRVGEARMLWLRRARTKHASDAESLSAAAADQAAADAGVQCESARRSAKSALAAFRDLGAGFSAHATALHRAVRSHGLQSSAELVWPPAAAAAPPATPPRPTRGAASAEGVEATPKATGQRSGYGLDASGGGDVRRGGAADGDRDGEHEHGLETGGSDGGQGDGEAHEGQDVLSDFESAGTRRGWVLALQTWGEVASEFAHLASVVVDEVVPALEEDVEVLGTWRKEAAASTSKAAKEAAAARAALSKCASRLQRHERDVEQRRVVLEQTLTETGARSLESHGDREGAHTGREAGGAGQTAAADAAPGSSGAAADREDGHGEEGGYEEGEEGEEEGDGFSPSGTARRRRHRGLVGSIGSMARGVTNVLRITSETASARVERLRQKYHAALEELDAATAARDAASSRVHEAVETQERRARELLASLAAAYDAHLHCTAAGLARLASTFRGALQRLARSQAQLLDTLKGLDAVEECEAFAHDHARTPPPLRQEKAAPLTLPPMLGGRPLSTSGRTRSRSRSLSSSSSRSSEESGSGQASSGGERSAGGDQYSSSEEEEEEEDLTASDSSADDADDADSAEWEEDEGCSSGLGSVGSGKPGKLVSASVDGDGKHLGGVSPRGSAERSYSEGGLEQRAWEMGSAGMATLPDGEGVIGEEPSLEHGQHEHVPEAEVERQGAGAPVSPRVVASGSSEGSVVVVGPEQNPVGSALPLSSSGAVQETPRRPEPVSSSSQGAQLSSQRSGAELASHVAVTSVPTSESGRIGESETQSEPDTVPEGGGDEEEKEEDDNDEGLQSAPGSPRRPLSVQVVTGDGETTNSSLSGPAAWAGAGSGAASGSERSMDGLGSPTSSVSTLSRARGRGDPAGRRQREFRARFAVGADETCLASHSCALLKRGFPHQGRLYVSPRFLCFSSSLSTCDPLIVPLRRVTRVRRRNAGGVLPVLDATTNRHQYTFSGLVGREECYQLLSRLALIESKFSNTLGSGAGPPAPNPNAADMAQAVTPPSTPRSVDAAVPIMHPPEPLDDAERERLRAGLMARPRPDRLPVTVAEAARQVLVLPGDSEDAARDALPGAAEVRETVLDTRLPGSVFVHFATAWASNTTLFREFLLRVGEIQPRVSAWRPTEEGRRLAETPCPLHWELFAPCTRRAVNRRAINMIGIRKTGTVTQQQRMTWLRDAEGRALLQVSTAHTVTGLPYCEYFTIYFTWLIRDEEDGCRAQVGCGLQFHKSTWIRSKIVSTTMKEGRAAMAAWADCSREALQDENAVRQAVDALLARGEAGGPVDVGLEEEEDNDAEAEGVTASGGDGQQAHAGGGSDRPAAAEGWKPGAALGLSTRTVLAVAVASNVVLLAALLWMMARMTALESALAEGRGK